ncbi:MAG: DUF5615 family PIN-like protein [Pseudonocardia sp.]|nr:DUF5615 family PIN-like protein [Pseudonocardia sp.]
MFPPGTSTLLAEYGHDAVHVRDRGLDARPDREVAACALWERRVLVTENVKDFASERDLVIVCVLKTRLPAGGMSRHLAEVLHVWATANPGPYVGLHWPKIGR